MVPTLLTRRQVAVSTHRSALPVPPHAERNGAQLGTARFIVDVFFRKRLTGAKRREWMGMWVAGINIDSYCGSFPHSLLSTSKTIRFEKWKMLLKCAGIIMWKHVKTIWQHQQLGNWRNNSIDDVSIFLITLAMNCGAIFGQPHFALHFLHKTSPFS